jgi:N,N'-diacetyllegionaminate synthase
MTKIIAEIGSNWTSFEDCKDSISMAKACGADAVKFQLFTSKELYGRPWGEVGGSQMNTASEWREEMDSAMPREWIPKLADKAKSIGIEFMCTAFSPEGYEFVNEFVQTHKVASSEMCHVGILKKLREFGKPVILSTGAQHMADIEMAIDVLKDRFEHNWDDEKQEYKENGLDVTLMYCEASYPAKWINFGSMLLLGHRTGYPIGFSDHTTSIIEIPGRAKVLGAKVIEKHFKIKDMDTPDSPHSVLPHEFKAMVMAMNGKWEAKIGQTPDETDMILKHKRRLIATRDISVGETLKEGENFGIYRSLIPDTKALSPFAIDSVNGKVSKNEIKAGEGIGPDILGMATRREEFGE